MQCGRPGIPADRQSFTLARREGQCPLESLGEKRNNVGRMADAVIDIAEGIVTGELHQEHEEIAIIEQ
jgi:hypothetical protein